MTLGLVDILKLAGFDATLPTRLVRHGDHRYRIDELRRDGWLEHYQSFQHKPEFHRAKQIVSFYGLPGTRAGFYGVYKVLGHQLCRGKEDPSCPLSKEWSRQSRFFYKLERDERFDDLRDRLIIDWGPGARRWVQKLDNKPLRELLEAGRKLPPFDDYLEFSLSYAHLKDLFSSETAHRDWKTALAAVAGVYLVLDEKSGDLYVGSASGVNGIWGRWREYAKSGHGNNQKLREVMKSAPTDYPKKFRFSVLQILPRSMARDEIVKRERMFKQKLGTRATGLNSN